MTFTQEVADKEAASGLPPENQGRNGHGQKSRRFGQKLADSNSDSEQLPADLDLVADQDSDALDSGPPTVKFTRQRVLLGAGTILVVVVALYYLLPQLAGLDQTWSRIKGASPVWLTLAVLGTIGAYAGYIALFHSVFARKHAAVGWRESYLITMASLLAARLFSPGGAGGILLTAWALRRSGMRRRKVADRTVSFIVVTYTTYILGLIFVGLGMYFGLFAGGESLLLTLIPAAVGIAVVGIILSIAWAPSDFQHRLEHFGAKKRRLGKTAQRAANIPASISAGMRDAYQHVLSRDPALLGVLAFWGFQLVVLWASFEAFGSAPPIPILIMAFLLGMIGNLLPMPGGVGGVESGMIGAFMAFNVDKGLALVAVLVYRVFVFWLPTIPGAIAYLQLRRTVGKWRRVRTLSPA